MAVPLPSIIPARLTRIREPFDHADWIFEVKHDGYRGFAYVERGSARLVSRNGNKFSGFHGLCSALADAFTGMTPSSTAKSSASGRMAGRCSIPCSAAGPSHTTMPSTALG